MEPITTQTPGGHTVTIKPTLNHPQKRRIQRILMSGARLDPRTNEQSFDLGVQIEAQDAMFKIMVVRLKLASGEVLEGGEAVYNGLSQVGDEDIQFLYDKLDELTREIDIFPNPERGKKSSA